MNENGIQETDSENIPLSQNGIPVNNKPKFNNLLATKYGCLCYKIWILPIVVIITIAVTVPATYYSKTTETCNCPENSTDPPYPKYDCNNKTTPIPEAICQLPFPEVGRSCKVKELGDIKCLLPYKGEFLMKANIYNNGKITRIWHCQDRDSNDPNYYKLVCDNHNIDGCSPGCDGNCQPFRFRRSNATTVVIVVDGSCLVNGGQIEIWDNDIFQGKRKRNANIFNRN